jgi:hypothetical protein
MGLLSFPVIWVFNTDLGPSISRPQFATKADLPARLPGRPERRLGLVEERQPGLSGTPSFSTCPNSSSTGVGRP